jgi:hypothetical protein
MAQLISNLGDEADQLSKVVLADGSVVAFEFIYLPAIERWSFNFSHPDLTVNSLILCAGPNVLRDYRNIIPFGLSVLSTDGADPVYIEDFTSGRITVYVLDADEVANVETNVFGATAPVAA